MRRIFSASILVLALSALLGEGPATLPSATGPSEEEARHQLEAIEPAVQGFSCSVMVSAVNSLRHLGKDRALKVLQEYYATKTDDHLSQELVVMCVCRTLFTPPEGGWKIPWSDYKYNLDSPSYDLTAKQKFPLYPIAMSDGVPFLLNHGWNGPNGRAPKPPDEGQRHLDICKNLKLLPDDLPTSGYEDAAKKLVNSGAFHDLFSSPNMTEATRDIPGQVLDQATNKARDRAPAAGASAATVPK